MWHPTTSLAEFFTDLSKQSRCFRPIIPAFEGQPFATREIRYRAGHWASCCLLCKAPADSKLMGTHRPLCEILKDEQLELAQTASERRPCLSGSSICVGVVPDSFKSWRLSEIYVVKAFLLCSVSSIPTGKAFSLLLAGRLPRCVLGRTVQGAETHFQSFGSIHTKKVRQLDLKAMGKSSQIMFLIPLRWQ